MAFTAQADDNGKILDGRCDVVLSGITPEARFWTLTLYDPDGGLVANSVGRYGFTSQEIVRRADGSFEVVVAPRARPAIGCRPAASSATYWCCASTTRRSGVSTKAGREAPMPAVTTQELPMIRWLLLLFGGALLGGIVHLATVLLLPRTATQDAYARLAPIAPVNTVVALPAPTPEKATMPFMDPAFAGAVCRYDLSQGPLKLTVPVSPAYTSVSFYTRYDVAYYAINDRAAGRRVIELDLMTTAQHDQLPEDEEVTAADRLIVESPTLTGLIAIRALAPEPGLMRAAQTAVAAARCGIAQPEPPKPAPAPARPPEPPPRPRR